MKILTRKKTLLFLVDEHKAYMDELALEFHDSSKYEIVHCYSVARMKELFTQENYLRYSIKIAVLSAYFNGEKARKVAELKDNLKEIKWMDPDIEMIVLLPEFSEKLENELISLGCYAVFQRNENAFLRINNNVRGIISRKSLETERRHTRITYLVLLLYVIALIITGGAVLLFRS